MRLLFARFVWDKSAALRFAPVRPAQYRSAFIIHALSSCAEVKSAPVRFESVKIAAGQNRSDEYGSGKVATSEVRFGEIGPGKVGPGQIRSGKVQFEEI